MLCVVNSEHGNKLAKTALRFLSGFTTLDFNKFNMYMRDRLVRLLHFASSVRKNIEVTDVCTACFKVGHRKNSTRKCKLHPNYKGGIQYILCACVCVCGLMRSEEKNGGTHLLQHTHTSLSIYLSLFLSYIVCMCMLFFLSRSSW